jgi:methionyl-tRNA synthetase
VSRYIVTITPPTPNGDLHLGHLSGPFLAADVCTRLLRQQGHDVLLLCYSDDYQSYLLLKGRQLGRNPSEIGLENTAAILDSLRRVNVLPSHWLRADDNRYFLEETSRYMKLLEASGNVAKRTFSAPFCEHCQVYGYEAFGRGRCSYCGSASDASQCECCARVPVVERMGPITCVLCASPMQIRQVSTLNWIIGRQYRSLRQRYLQVSRRTALVDLLRETLRCETDEWQLTRPGEKAIPLDHRPGEEVHTWFAGLAGYRAALREHLATKGLYDELDSWWSPDTVMIQFLGFDCSYSHAVAYAALLDLEAAAPRTLRHFTNRFLQLDGEDFSTSRNHAVWVRDLVPDFPSDAVRLYTALIAPEEAVRNFQRSDFQRWYRERFLQIAGADRGGPVTSALPSLSATLKLSYAPLVHEWQTAVDFETFSISHLAEVQLKLLDLALRAPTHDRAFLWLASAELGAALHPNLSHDIRTSLQQHGSQRRFALEHYLSV